MSLALARVSYKGIPIKVYGTHARPMFAVGHIDFLEPKNIRALVPYTRGIIYTNVGDPWSAVPVVSENGIVELARSSRISESFAFEKWFFTEMLPPLRVELFNASLMLSSDPIIEPAATSASKFTYILRTAPHNYTFGTTEDVTAIIREFTTPEFEPVLITFWTNSRTAEGLIETHAGGRGVVDSRSIITNDIWWVVSVVNHAMERGAEIAAAARPYCVS